MIVLFSDFGGHDPYVGQMKAVLAAQAPGQPIIDLLHDVPDFNAHAGAHLLAALSTGIPAGAVFVCVVDPGVGSARPAVVVEADERWYVGPDNGLLSIIASRTRQSRYWRINWRPEQLSSSFHGRDLFAPIAAEIAMGAFPEARLESIDGLEVNFDPGELARVIYIDHYGNAWTGMRGGVIDSLGEIAVGSQRLSRRLAFHEAGKGELFWYVNSVGLVEIAANRASAAAMLGLTIGSPVNLADRAGTRH